MYLVEPSLSDVVKKQISFKFKAYPSIWTSLLVVQLLALALGVGPFSSGSMSSDDMLVISHSEISSDLTSVFTIIWAMLTGFLLATTAYFNEAFAFTTNRISHHLSNIFILLFASTIAGVFVTLTGPLLKLVTFLRLDSLYSEPFDLSVLLLQLGTAVFYMLLFSAFGYLLGSLFQRVIWIILLIIMLFLFFFFIFGSTSGQTIFEQIVQFFFSEHSFPLFVGKVSLTALLFFAISIVTTQKIEVRK